MADDGHGSTIGSGPCRLAEGSEARWHVLAHDPQVPPSEMFGLTSRITRAASSITGNIAEGYGRELTVTYIHPLRIAQGSLKELESHSLLAVEVELLEQQACLSLLVDCEEVGKMLRSLIRALQEKTASEAEG